MDRVEDSTTAATAARRMRTLHDDYLTRTRPGSIVRAPRSREVDAPAPIDLDILDYVESCVQEAKELTYRVAPDAGPAPRDAHEIPQWAVEATATAGPYERQARDALLYKQGLEHAFLMGETWRIRRHPCPRCGRWGLFVTAGRIVCAHTRCTGEDGLASTWTLAQIARAYVANSSSSQASAT